MAITTAMIERLRGQITDADVLVTSGSYISGATNINMILPAVCVIPGGASMGDNKPGDGRVQKDTVTYWVVIILPFIGDDKNADHPEDSAEQYIHEVKQALIGWRPEDGYQPFAYSGEPEPEYDAGGFVKFAVTFESGRLTVGV